MKGIGVLYMNGVKLGNVTSLAMSQKETIEDMMLGINERFDAFIEGSIELKWNDVEMYNYYSFMLKEKCGAIKVNVLGSGKTKRLRKKRFSSIRSLYDEFY